MQEPLQELVGELAALLPEHSWVGEGRTKGIPDHVSAPIHAVLTYCFVRFVDLLLLALCQAA